MKIEYLKNYWCSIKVFDIRGQAYGVVNYKIWDNLPFQLLCKWRWYFEYHAALLKVKNPRCKVEMLIGQKEPDKKTKSDFLKDKIIGKKRMITKLTNELELHKKFLIDNNIFGLIGDDGRIEKAELKIKKYRGELQELQCIILEVM